MGEHDLARAIVEHYQVPYIDLRNYTIHKDLVKEVPPALLNRARVVPLDRYAKQISYKAKAIAEIATVQAGTAGLTGGGTAKEPETTGEQAKEEPKKEEPLPV